MFTVLVISIIIVFVILVLALLTTSKAYQFKHTVDSLKENEFTNPSNVENDEKKQGE